MSGSKLAVWPGRRGDGPVAFGISGALTALDQDMAKKVAHDFVVNSTGARRAGPIQWLVLDYHGEGLAKLAQLDVDAQDGLHAFLRQSPVSVLVLAFAATDRPRSSRRRRR